jgi:hypothetical protein
MRKKYFIPASPSNRNCEIISYFLCYVSISKRQYKVIVKVGIGSFRLAATYLHLHKQFNFTESLLETRGEVVTPFMQVGTYPTGNFATLEPFRSTAAVYWSLDSMLSHILFTFQQPGRCQTLYFILLFSESYVFNKQSLPPGCATIV